MVLWRGHPQALKFETEVEGYLHLLDKELKERSVEERAREAEEEEEEREEDGEQGVGKLIGQGLRSSLVTSVESLDGERSSTANSVQSLWQMQADVGHLATQLVEEKLCALQQKMELDLLKIERILDRERIISLLKATAPDVETDDESAALLRRLTQSGDVERVDPERIRQLQLRLRETGKVFLRRESAMRMDMSSKISSRAGHELKYRQMLSTGRQEVAGAQRRVKEEEDKLFRTTLDLLNLRYRVLVARRLEAEAAMEESQSHKDHVQRLYKFQTSIQKQVDSMPTVVDTEVSKLVKRLREQTLLCEQGACMLKEQHDQAQPLHEKRVAKLTEKLAIWRKKRKNLSRLHNSEVEAYTRASEDLRRRHEKNQMLRATAPPTP